EPARPAHDIPRQEWTIEDVMEGARSAQERPRPPSALPTVEERATAAHTELPEWAGRAMEQAGISTAGMDRAAVMHVAQRVQADSAFAGRLREVIAALESAPQHAPSRAQPGPGPTAGDRAGDDPGDGAIRWADTEGRGGVPGLPRITAAMFDGSVPARLEFIVLFDVDHRGNVIPGSIVFQTRSGYTRVNEEVRRTIRGWTFEPKQGAPSESAIFTLIVYREDVL
ncbi:MAG: hypothetical protein EA384_06965, partial [Spirochaetaceae bacterium]